MEFYRDVDSQHCQGDILDDIPSLILKLPMRVLKKRTGPGGAEVLETAQALDPKITPAEWQQGQQVSAFCQVSRAMLLTHGCEIDKDPKHRLVALVRPLALVPPESSQKIRNHQNFSYFYLPPDSSRGLEEGYADFRRISCISPEMLAQSIRRASLTDDAVRGLHFQLYRYLTRREIT